MRGYECHYFFMSNNGELYKASNHACWGGMKGKAYLPDIVPLQYAPENDYSTEYIYVDQYIQNEVSDKDRKRLVYLINFITPCKFVTIKKKKYIKIKLVDGYDKNLVILNFIRGLWYLPTNFDMEQFYKDIHKRRSKGKDALEFLLECLRDNVKLDGTYYGDHSSIYKYIKPKTIEKLFNFKGHSVKDFLCS